MWSLVLGLTTARPVACHLQLTCPYVSPTHVLSCKVFHVTLCDLGALRPSWEVTIAGIGLKAQIAQDSGLWA